VIFRKTLKFPQAATSEISPERDHNVSGVHSRNDPKPSLFLDFLNVCRPDQMAICKTPIGPRVGVTKHDAQGTARMEIDVYEVRRHRRLITMAYGPTNAKKVEI
jgi:hypothetical protein